MNKFPGKIKKINWNEFDVVIIGSRRDYHKDPEHFLKKFEKLNTPPPFLKTASHQLSGTVIIGTSWISKREAFISYPHYGKRLLITVNRIPFFNIFMQMRL